jgi:hypothetical protein
MHFYMHSYLHKIFILVKSGCYTCAAQSASVMAQRFVGMHPRSDAESNSLSESDPIASDLTR